MTVDWGRDGPDLLLTLDHDAPLGAQLQDQMRAAIREGRLAAGERLPSTRRLAERLRVSRGTVVEVYEQLLAEGYVESAIGSGTRVAAVALLSSGDTKVQSGPNTTQVKPDIDFEYGIPDLSSVPLADWARAVSEATRKLPTAELGDEAPAGSKHLREVVSAYHRRVRAGCAVAQDAIVVGGFRQGLAFALSTLAKHGIRRLALEDPGPRDHDVIARRAGLEPVPVPVDGDGLDVRRLRESGARAVLLTPAHQCPTGVVLGPLRRRELVAWASDVDGVMLEDDYDAEFRYDRQPVGSLQGLDPDRVIALGSVSKTLAPTIRLGWVFAPRRFLDGIIEEKRLSSRGAPGLDQEALALLMESGRYDRHLRRVREIYRARRGVLVAAVQAEFGAQARLQGLSAGCHALLRLPESVSEQGVVEAARSRLVGVRGLGDYRFAPGSTHVQPHPWSPALVLGFGNVTENQIRRGIRILAEAVR
ncbi:GntR family transcriptional regulator [Rhizocola hellebori]|uniref:GntR family transcriptional regulator n=1 Tax=Rhizocola hellebori TaxID=1392758 RepID=A0A8J3Q2X9_9ACTN|nr:PLP-dependent aminotransferase family protein [Rhizocola hellebori]GIH02671.1 GntR family transcriptional regulator [Rhizocola hellebori]